MNEFPRPLAVTALPEEGTSFEVTATPQERRALAERLGLIALESLCARGRIEPVEPGGLLRLSGTFEAAVVQECVVSLEPVAATLGAPLQRCFSLAPLPPEGTLEVMVEPEDEIEPLAGDVLDVGEVVAEELALALDPYPRRSDAAAAVADRLGPQVTLNAPEERSRPFAALRPLAR